MQQSGQFRLGTVDLLSQANQLIVEIGDLDLGTQHVLLARLPRSILTVCNPHEVQQELAIVFCNADGLLNEVQLVVDPLDLFDDLQLHGRELCPGDVRIRLGGRGLRFQFAEPG